MRTSTRTPSDFSQTQKLSNQRQTGQGHALLGFEQVERLDLEADGLRAREAKLSAMQCRYDDAPKVLQSTEARQLLAQVIQSLGIRDELAWDRLGDRAMGRRHREAAWRLVDAPRSLEVAERRSIRTS